VIRAERLVHRVVFVNRRDYWIVESRENAANKIFREGRVRVGLVCVNNVEVIHGRKFNMCCNKIMHCLLKYTCKSGGFNVWWQR